MKKLVLFALPLSGCLVYTDGSDPTPNSAPWFEYADAGCVWDRGYQDYVWFFDVDVNDDTGADSVQFVWADVYDNRTGELVDSFDLQPEPGMSWYSAWVGSTTFLDPGYPNYEVFIQAEDPRGEIGTTSVFPPPCI